MRLAALGRGHASVLDIFCIVFLAIYQYQISHTPTLEQNGAALLAKLIMI
jgi:hypothetical protein